VQKENAVQFSAGSAIVFHANAKLSAGSFLHRSSGFEHQNIRRPDVDAVTSTLGARATDGISGRANFPCTQSLGYATR
jgi:hypothetical protein